MKHRVLQVASALAMAGTALAAPAAQACDRVETAQSDSQRLRALMAESDAAFLDRNPRAAFYRGDFSDAGSLGDFSPAAYETERAAAMCDIAALATIDRAALTASERIAYDTFRYSQERTLAATEPDVLKTILALPIDHFQGIQGSYPGLSAPDGVMPFTAVEDYADNVARHAAYAQMVDDVIARFDTGLEQGITLPRLTVELMIDQLDTQLGAPEGSNPYYAPLRQLPESFTEAEKGQARAALISAVEGTLYPAMRKLRAYLADSYLPQARTSIGATATPGGDAYYAYRIAEMTTLPLTAQQIHETGLAEVARINAAIDAAEAEADGRTGKTYTSKADLQAAWYEVAEQVDPLMERVFLRQPKTELRIEPYEPYREKFSLAASYSAGKADGTRPGTFYFSGWNAAERELSPSIRLYMHEGNPGHHFQVMFAVEDESLPDLLRHGWFTAYGEGWALYAESLGYELGLYDDPVDRLQALEDGELKRAVRLVVDTGMHALGWSREQAIEYMVANGAARDFAESESARYIVMPAQALAYKTGELKIKQLRARAEAALGEDFDIREFHAEVLDTGSLPMPVLENKIDRWIASKAS